MRHPALRRALSALSAAACAALLSQHAAAQRRPRRAPAPSCQTAAQSALDGLGDAVRACLANVTFQRAQTTVNVSLNNHAELISVAVRAQTDGADHAPTVQCVERAVRAARWPTCATTPLLTLERSWSFQVAPTP